MTRPLLTVASYAAGFALAMSLLAHLSGYGRLNGAVVFVWIFLAAGFGWMVARVLRKRVSATATGCIRSAVYVVLSAAAAGTIYYLLPLSAYQFPKVATLEVVATGQRNPASQGAEVWAKVMLPNGHPVRPRTEGGRGWTRRDDGVAMSPGSEAGTIAWDIKIASGAVLQLTRHAWSGIAEVTWAGEKTNIDLYSASNDATATVQLSGKPLLSAQDRRLAVLVGASDVIALTFAIFLLCLELFKRRSHSIPN